MNKIMSVACATALTMACLEGRAKPIDKCIVALEAHDARIEAPSPQRPCPTAIAFQSRSRDSRTRVDRRPAPSIDSAVPDAIAADPATSVPSERALHA